MKKHITLIVLFISFFGVAQNENGTYTKRVLENAEVDLISSFYSQDGDNAGVTGGIGTEKLTDLASTITIAIPLNANDVLTIDGTISAYTSASSSNLNPFDGGTYTTSSTISAKSSASTTPKSTPSKFNTITKTNSNGSPWVESTGASRSDVW